MVAEIIEQDIPAVAATAKRGRKGSLNLFHFIFVYFTWEVVVARADVVFTGTNSIGLSDDGIGSPTHNTFGPLPPSMSFYFPC